jgi:hypothetical protein
MRALVLGLLAVAAVAGAQAVSDCGPAWSGCGPAGGPTTSTTTTSTAAPTTTTTTTAATTTTT